MRGARLPDTSFDWFGGWPFLESLCLLCVCSYIDVLELAPSASASENLDAPVSVPQSAAIAVRRARARSIGSDVAQALDSLSVFVVGSGAIGCELIKNLAQLGVSSSQNAKSYVTDPDTVEASNLCRQFLFSSQDVDCVKSEAAVKAIKSIRPNFQVIFFLELPAS